MRVSVIVPAHNEEEAIGKVLAEIPRDLVAEVIVVDNGSTDNTARVAETYGARVISEPRRGYGRACLAGIAALGDADVVVFLDGDHSDYPEQMRQLLDPIQRGEADLVIGSRTLGRRQLGALAPHARLGNWLATLLIRLLYGAKYTDLGPFRAIRSSALRKLKMRDTGFGWTVEMQVKALKCGLRTKEVPVDYRRRLGKSKISGTLVGSICAGCKIILTIFKLRFRSL